MAERVAGEMIKQLQCCAGDCDWKGTATFIGDPSIVALDEWHRHLEDHTPDCIAVDVPSHRATQFFRGADQVLPPWLTVICDCGERFTGRADQSADAVNLFRDHVLRAKGQLSE